jgi:hypothetical protein
MGLLPICLLAHKLSTIYCHGKNEKIKLYIYSIFVQGRNNWQQVALPCFIFKKEHLNQLEQ